MKQLTTVVRQFKQWVLSIVSKRSSQIQKDWNDMTLYEKWQDARNMFQHYAIRFMYDYGVEYRSCVTSEERLYCRDMANYWDMMIKKYRNEIITQQH